MCIFALWNILQVCVVVQVFLFVVVMIRAVLVINNHGKPRLTKFYEYMREDQQQQIIR